MRRSPIRTRPRQARSQHCSETWLERDQERRVASAGSTGIRRIRDGGSGERKSLFYEHQRTGHMPRWQGFETCYAGYDVLSVRDSQHQEALKIEVKASDRNFRYAEIHLTEHEWITASKSVGSYLFHIWLFDEVQSRLFIVDSSTIIAHVPTNQGRGRWRDTTIPLGAITHPSQAVVVPD
jgi:hypothetical protein